MVIWVEMIEQRAERRLRLKKGVWEERDRLKTM